MKKLIFTVLVLVLFPVQAWALSCISQPATAQDIIAAPIIFKGKGLEAFEGRIVNGKAVSYPYTRFEIVELYKGRRTDAIDVHYPYKKGYGVGYEIIMIPSLTKDDELFTSRCGREVDMFQLQVIKWAYRTPFPHLILYGHDTWKYILHLYYKLRLKKIDSVVFWVSFAKALLAFFVVFFTVVVGVKAFKKAVKE